MSLKIRTVTVYVVTATDADALVEVWSRGSRQDADDLALEGRGSGDGRSYMVHRLTQVMPDRLHEAAGTVTL